LKQVLLQLIALKPPTLKSNLLRRLPKGHVTLLRELGNIADRRQISLYLVGGVVRDLLLNRKNWDLDLTVQGDGIAFARSIAEQYRAGIVLFERFATARLTMPSGQKIDIASTRRESYATPAALPNVEPSSLQEDLYRRDFTINAMAIQLNTGTFGRLHDPFGGRQDLQSKTLRVLHEHSFRDDPTRIFRAIRFMQRFGFELEPATRRLLREASARNLISRVSGHRLRNEMLLLFGERHPDYAIEHLVRLKLLRFVHPRLRYTEKIKRLMASIPRTCAWWKKQRLGPQGDVPLIYLMALLSESHPSVIRSVGRRLQLSSEQRMAVERSGTQTDQILERLSGDNKMRPFQVHRLLTGLPSEALLLLMAKAQGLATSRAAGRCRQQIARYLKRDRRVAIYVTGADLMKLGLEPGPQYGRILERLLEARMDGDVRTEAGERELAYRMVNQGGRRPSS
jgi:tRNA nucleotidyltransferase (CCA-adding enzyme)